MGQRTGGYNREEEMFVDTVLYPQTMGGTRGHISADPWNEVRLHDEYGEPGEATSDVSGSWGGGALWEAQWVHAGDLGTVAPAASP